MYYKSVTDSIVFDTFTKRYKNKSEVSDVLNTLTVDQLNRVREMRSKNKLNIIITLTTECDLRCDYCFENHLKREHMTMETCRNLLHEIKQFIESHMIRNVDCILFGGEPLLNAYVLKHFTLELRRFCDANTVELCMLITTNGVLYNAEKHAFLKETGVKNIQITFDGTEETNNRRRRAKKLECNPYQSIVNNLPDMVRNFENVFIKFNFDSDNYNEYKPFLYDIDRVVKAHKKNTIIVLETIHETPFAHYGHSYDTRSRELASEFVELIRTTIDAGFNYITKVFTTPCMHTCSNSFMIDTSGYAYSCISSFGLSEFKLGEFSGNMFSGNETVREQNNKIEVLKSHCSSCCYLPICWGGCAYLLQTEGKNIYRDLLCRKVYFDTIIKMFYEEISLKYGVMKIE